MKKSSFCFETIVLIMLNIFLVGMIADEITGGREPSVTTQVDLLFHHR